MDYINRHREWRIKQNSNYVLLILIQFQMIWMHLSFEHCVIVGIQKLIWLSVWAYGKIISMQSPLNLSISRLLMSQCSSEEMEIEEKTNMYLTCKSWTFDVNEETQETKVKIDSIDTQLFTHLQASEYLPLLYSILSVNTKYLSMTKRSFLIFHGNCQSKEIFSTQTHSSACVKDYRDVWHVHYHLKIYHWANQILSFDSADDRCSVSHELDATNLSCHFHQSESIPFNYLDS